MRKDFAAVVKRTPFDPGSSPWLQHLEHNICPDIVVDCDNEITNALPIQQWQSAVVVVVG